VRERQNRVTSLRLSSIVNAVCFGGAYRQLVSNHGSAQQAEMPPASSSRTGGTQQVAMPPATRPKIYLVRQSFRVVLLGDVNVGKSSLALNFIKSHKAGYGEYLPTIGAAFVSRVLQVEGIDDDAIGRRQSFKLEIWDTAGEERFHSIAPLYYRGAQAAVIVYDVIDDHSYMRAKKWFTELQERRDEGIVISLAGNKAGLDGGRIVERADVADYAKAKERSSLRPPPSLVAMWRSCSPSLPRGAPRTGGKSAAKADSIGDAGV
jgi:Ras-related protein Rab-5C